MVQPILTAALIASVVLVAEAASPEFTVTSSAFRAGEPIPHVYSYSGYGCDGRNTSPEVAWDGAPPGTKVFALTMFDPDARSGQGWWHWIVFNIPATATKLQTNAGSGSGDLMPAGAVQGRNDFQTLGYGGPCPPAGSPPHHYHFTLYALDQQLDGLSPLTSGPTLLKAIRGHVLAKTELIGLFSR
jgi:Raf kinase inhibitor-like YbhB/YbcL family protein